MDNQLTFQQLLAAKVEAEKEIAAALKKFTEATGHRVSGVGINKMGDTLEGILNYKEYRVEMDVRVAF